jgi:hypothetical protein
LKLQYSTAGLDSRRQPQKQQSEVDASMHHFISAPDYLKGLMIGVRIGALWA